MKLFLSQSQNFLWCLMLLSTTTHIWFLVCHETRNSSCQIDVRYEASVRSKTGKHSRCLFYSDAAATVRDSCLLGGDFLSEEEADDPMRRQELNGGTYTRKTSLSPSPCDSTTIVLPSHLVNVNTTCACSFTAAFPPYVKQRDVCIQNSQAKPYTNNARQAVKGITAHFITWRRKKHVLEDGVAFICSAGTVGNVISK